MAFGDLKGTLSVAQNSITNPTSATGSVSVSVGDLVYVVGNEQANNTWGAASDNLGNSYTDLNAGSDAGVMAARAYYSRVTVAGTLTQVDVAATASSDNAVLIAAVIEGPFATSPLDANPANATNDVSDPLTCPATGVLAQADEVVMCFYASNGNPTVNADSPNLLALELNSGTTLNTSVGYQTVAATTSVQPTFDLSGSPTASVLGTASFKKSNNISLTADAGSYAFSGTAASLELGRVVVGGAGSYALTGAAASLELGRVVAAGGGSYAVTGTDASLSITAKVLAAAAGSYAITGTDVTLSLVKKVVAGAGSYALTGTDAGLSITAKRLAAAAGAYEITGADAAFDISKKIFAGAGSYAISGTDAALELSRLIAADGGSYALTGSAATLSKALTLTAGGGSYAFSGVAAGLELGRAVIAASGSYLIVGKQVALVAPGDSSFGDVRYWNGTEWIAAVLKTWNGSEWV